MDDGQLVARSSVRIMDKKTSDTKPSSSIRHSLITPSSTKPSDR